MPIEILMPALSPTMTEGNLVTWLKKEGDAVSSGDIIAEIETDKATMEVETVDDGVLGKILVPAGTENVRVNSVIALLLEEGEASSEIENYTEKGNEAEAEVPVSQPVDVMREASVDAGVKHKSGDDVSISTHTEGARVKISPLAKRLAKEKGLDLHTITGSGPKGRIIKRDIESQQNVPATSLAYTSGMAVSNDDGPAYRDAPLSNMRKVIAKRLLESKQTVPHFYLTIEVLMDELLSVRKRLNEGLEEHKVTVNDFVIRAVALALRDVPEANASWLGDAVRYYRHSDISVAVAIDDGLITPILKAAELKSILTLSYEMKSLAARAREGKLKPDEFQGGSFSISNLGMYGIKEFSAIINPPQACILAVGAGSPRPVVKDGAIVPAVVMSCTLSVDHRVVDGKVGADFMAAFKKYIENPLLMMA